MIRRVGTVALVVLLPVMVGAARATDEPCSSTDGPQFRCWLLPDTR